MVHIHLFVMSSDSFVGYSDEYCLCISIDWILITFKYDNILCCCSVSFMVNSYLFMSLLDQILKKICDHPLLLTKKAAEGVLEGMDAMLNHDELGMVESMAKKLANMTDYDDAQKLDHNVSCKISFVMVLLVRHISFSF